jgi:hypothetical protein
VRDGILRPRAGARVQAGEFLKFLATKQCCGRLWRGGIGGGGESAHAYDAHGGCEIRRPDQRRRSWRNGDAFGVSAQRWGEGR